MYVIVSSAPRNTYAVNDAGMISSVLQKANESKSVVHIFWDVTGKNNLVQKLVILLQNTDSAVNWAGS